MDNSYGLWKVQEANLYMLKEVDRICQKYRINYMLDSGTLLGAIRHGGFIPWDDDADIAMTRSAFEAFKKVAKRELPEDLTLLLPKDLAGGRAFYDFTPRILLKRSRRRKGDREDAYYAGQLNHLWIDIFILDGISGGGPGEKLAILLQKKMYLLSMGHRFRIDYSSYPLFMGLLIRIASFLGRWISMPLLYKGQDFFARFFSPKNPEIFYYSNYQPDYLHIRMKKEWLAETTSIHFENTQLCISEHYDRILRNLYGDYMRLPRKEKQRPTHGSLEIEVDDRKE